jgi:hypothetical protein
MAAPMTSAYATPMASSPLPFASALPPVATQPVPLAPPELAALPVLPEILPGGAVPPTQIPLDVVLQLLAAMQQNKSTHVPSIGKEADKIVVSKLPSHGEYAQWRL